MDSRSRMHAAMNPADGRPVGSVPVMSQEAPGHTLRHAGSDPFGDPRERTRIDSRRDCVLSGVVSAPDARPASVAVTAPPTEAAAWT